MCRQITIQAPGRPGLRLVPVSSSVAPEPARGRAGARSAGRVRFLAVFAATLGATLVWSSCARRDPPAAPGQDTPAAAVPVTVTNAVVADVPERITGIGTVHAYSTVAVKSENKGQLARVGFQQGDEVRAGDLIFLVDPNPYQGALDQMEANLSRDRALLAKAQADFRRDLELLTNNIISHADFDQDRANVDSLLATLQADAAAVTNAQVQLSYCSIRSPINGRVGTLLVNAGNIVKDLDTVLAVINQVQPIFVDFSVPERYLSEVRDHLRAGPLKVEARVPGYERRRAEGHLLLIDNQVDTTTGTILLRAEFANADEMLWPGQFVKVALTLALARNAVLVPSAAIQLAQDGQSVCVVKPDDTVEFRAVEVGDAYGSLTVIKKGVTPGERVVTSGQLRLSPGAKVKIITAETQAGLKPSGA